MSDVKNYLIPLNGISPEDNFALKTLFEVHSKLFDGAILSVYGGDVRYAVVEEALPLRVYPTGR